MAVRQHDVDGPLGYSIQNVFVDLQGKPGDANKTNFAGLLEFLKGGKCLLDDLQIEKIVTRSLLALKIAIN